MPVRKQPYRWLTPEKRQQIIDTYHPGMTLKEVGSIVGYSDTACKRVLNAEGIATPSRRWFWTKELDAQLIELCNSGLNAEEVASRMNLKTTQIFNRVSILRHEGKKIILSYSRKSNNGTN